MIVYKACKTLNGKTVSSSAPKEGEVEYKIGETTVPREGCGPLAACESVEKIIEELGLWYYIPTYIYYKCEAEVIEDPDTDGLWVNNKAKESNMLQIEHFTHTLFCSSITPLEVVSATK